MLIIGHRGAMALAPENTLSSIQRAIELDVDMVEIDIQQIEDQLILIHDDTLERTTNGKGNLADHTFTQLRTLDAGGGEQIPTLAEVLELTRNKVRLNIEIKSKHNSLIPLLMGTIDGEENIIISSFHREQLYHVRKLDPIIDIGVLGEDPFADAIALGAVSVNPSIDELNAAYMQRARELEFKVHTYTVKTDTDWQKAKKYEVDGCFINDPTVYHKDNI